MTRKLAFALLLAVSPLALTQSSSAQNTTAQTAEAHRGGRHGGNRQQGDRVEKMTRRLTEKLSLSADQTAKVRDILTRAGATARQNAEAATDRDGKRQAMQAAMKAAEPQIEAILTDAQKKTYTEMRARRGDGEGRGRGRGGDRSGR